MLQNWSAPQSPSKEQVDARRKAAREKLVKLSLAIKQKGLPVLVLVEGWGASGKGSMIGRIISQIDPRFYDVTSMSAPTAEELRRPFLYRYMRAVPEAGKFAFLDSGWMDEVVKDRLHNQLEEEKYEHRIRSVNRFERTLADNGYLVLKLFLQIEQKEQEKRLQKLLSDEDTSWRVSENDKWQNKHYRECCEVFGRYMAATNLPACPWYVVDAQEKKWAETQILEILNEGIETALQNGSIASPILQNTFPLVPMQPLEEIPLDETVTISEEEYDRQRKKLQEKLSRLHNRLYRKKVPVIIVYEGWDAAGKGGNIKRVTAALDARGYQVLPIAGPEPHEKARHYLWRFWTRLPKDGHIAIFDRSWYGRVMVERIEGFCSENDWRRAYNEINEFEAELVDWGAVVLKFWVQIDKDTQLERFTLRQNTPEKQWKITQEDWRNREKWDDYEVAVNEMLQKTSTQQAPWHILESVDKHYARIKALRIIVDALEKALE